MKTVYRVLAYLVAVEVMIQAAAIAFGVFGENKFIDGGGVIDKASVEAAMASGELPFAGVLGYIVHGINGQNVVPLIALLLLVVSFFAKVPGGVKWAGIVLLTVVVQVLLGIFSSSIPELGILHGINALLLFSFAAVAARRVTTGSAPGARTGAAVG